MVIDKRSQMIEENIGLVHSVAKRFKGRGVDYEDLFQSGCIGLIKAVDHFDEEKGFQFSTYAVPVIMGEIKRVFRDGGAIKVGRSLKEKSLRAQVLRDRFLKKELREPTVSELADMLGCDVNETAEILNVIHPMLSINQFGEDGRADFDIPVDDSD
ncbi:MAG: sigma-70 family RNA polymerase sigma factor, partial [Eubacterium sp.]